MKRTTWILILVVLAATAGCAGLATAQDGRYAGLEPLGPPPIPLDNVQTPEKVALGKLLFFDSRLSGDDAISCASCHDPGAGWAFPNPISLGYPGTVHWRNSQTIVNAA